jgi:hypothetical protein
MTFVNKLNYNANGNQVVDEVITLSGGNKVISLAHHNLMTVPTSIQIWTGVGKTGTQIVDFTTAMNATKAWVTDVTFGSSVGNGTYYATYYSEGDENDADDINTIQSAITTLQTNANNAGKLVARYVHSGNKVIQPTALNTTTGVFTTATSLTGLGLAVGSYNLAIFNMHTWNTKILPVEINPINTYYVYVASDTTFQLSTSNTSAGLVSSYPNASNTAIDCSQFHFETGATGNFTVDLTGLNLSDIRVKTDVQRERGGWAYVYLQGTSDETPSFANYAGGAVDGRSTQSLYMEHHFKYNPESKTIWGTVEHTQSRVWGNVSGGTWTDSSTNDTVACAQWKPYTNFKITGIRFAFIFANNSVIEVYDMKGSY